MPFKRVPLAQNLLDMPRDRLALAVRVGGEEEVLGAFQRPGDLLDALLGAVVDFPGHGEVFVGLHRAVLRRQIADMAVAREDGEVLAEILVDGLRLGGRFDDNDIIHGRSRLRGAEQIVIQSGLKQGHLVSGLPFEPSGQRNFQQNGRNQGGRQLVARTTSSTATGVGDRLSMIFRRAESRSPVPAPRLVVEGKIGRRSEGRRAGDNSARISSTLSVSVAPLADEIVRAAAARVHRRARHREHVAPLLQREPSRDERAGLERGFDDSTPSETPETMRLRRGKCRANGSVPIGISAKIRPRSAIASCSARFSSG